MKKIVILIVLGALLLAACTNETSGVATPYAPTAPAQTAPTTQQPDETTQPKNESNAAPAFALTVGTFTIRMDQNIQEVLDTMGEPLGVFEAPSCAFDGIDRIFSFPGLQIHTYPLDESDFIHTISIRDDSIMTQNGIYLGNSLDNVLAAYGDNYQQEFGMFTFTKGVTTLQFLIEYDMVVAITYGLILS